MKEFRNKRTTLIIFFLVILCVGNIYISRNYVIMMPGIAKDLESIIEVNKNGVSKDEKGSFLLITVSTRSANLPLLIYSAVNPYAKIYKRMEIVPRNLDKNEYLNLTKEMMEESQTVAKVVALKKAGYNIDIKNQGVKVVKVFSKSNAFNKINEGDVILSVDGKETKETDNLVKEIRNKSPGETVILKIIRDGKEKFVLVKTMENNENEDKIGLGLYIKNDNIVTDFPILIEIDTGEISGPSAGVMFALEIYNQLSDIDLTAGKIIAGTGTLSIDGSIGEVGGIIQKVITAHKNGADIFFIPVGNYKDAESIALKYDMTLVPIDNFEDAIMYLQNM